MGKDFNLYILFLLIIPTLAIILYFFKSIKRSFYKNRSKIRFILFSNRMNSLRNFEKLSETVMKDILEALKTENNSHEQARALLPLLLDVRKTGEKLLAQQHFYHTILFPIGESRLKPRIDRLIQIEKLLKSLPRQGDLNHG
jgi:hypothetical protein